jgi:hypothetical protein
VKRIFALGPKAGTLFDGLLYDTGALFSIALQYGAPASPVGEKIDVIIEQAATSNKPNSEDATDAYIPIIADQAKESTWELFTV